MTAETSGPAGTDVSGPFAGLRVVEFGRFIAAPYCGQLLADGGADVIKVEPLEGDESRLNSPLAPGEGRQFLNKNRGKRSIAVNLREQRVLAAMTRLAVSADVVIANFRPGVAQRLGLDYETLAAMNPRVIYAENTAFGDRGPLAAAPGMNTILECYAGMAQLTPDGPRSHGEPFVDYGAALLLAWGIAGALYHRERSGRGQRVSTSLLQSALTLQNNTINEIDRFDAPRRAAAEQLKSDLTAGMSWAEALARRQASSDARLAAAYHGVHQTADGFITIASPGRANQSKLLELLHLEDRWVTEPGWEPDDPAEHAARMQAQVAARFREQPSEYWLRALGEVGLPVGRVQLKEDVLQDGHIWENGFLVRLEHERLGGMTVVAPPVHFSETPLAARHAPPVLGRHTRAVLHEAGLSDGEIDALVADGAVREPQQEA